MSAPQSLVSMLGTRGSSTARTAAALEATIQQLMASGSIQQNVCSVCSKCYATSAGRRVGSGLRRVDNKSSIAATAAASDAEGAASSSGQSNSSLLEMTNEVPGGSKPLRSWEKWYWGVGVVGISGILYWNLKKPEPTPEEKAAAQQRAAELEAQRKEHLRAVLMGSNFLEGEKDPLDGLSPQQIVQFMQKHAIDPLDPLEGLTPEEIDAYVQQQEAKRSAANS